MTRPTASSAIDNERGAVLVFVALTLLVLLLCGALAVDVSALERRGQTLQNTVDSAALAASATWVRTGDRDQAAAVAAEIIEQNGLGADSDVQAAVTFPDPWSVDVNLTDASPEVFLASVVGFGGEVNRDARAELSLCDQDCGFDVALSPPFSSVVAVGEGDGFVPISVGNRFYAINHHGTDIACVDRTTLAPCFAARRAYHNGTDALSDQMPHAVTQGTRIWWTAQEPSRLALYCWETTVDLPCNQVRTVNTSLRADHLEDNYRSRGGGTVEFDGRLYMFSDNHQVHCFIPEVEQWCAGYPQSTDLSGTVPPWNPSMGQTGAGIDRIIDEQTGRIYYTIRARYAGGGIPAGTWLDCWNASTNSKCAGFTPNMIHQSGERQAGRPFFHRTTAGAIQGVCSTGISEIVCVELDGDDASWFEDELDELEQALPPAVNYHNAQGTHLYHPPTNRLFLTNPRWMSTITCWDFTEGESCGSLYGMQGGVETADYGFIYEGNCLFALGHNSIFWSFTADLAVGCPGSTGVARIDPCSCRDEELWGTIDFNFDADAFDAFDVQILDPAGNVVLPVDGSSVISLSDDRRSIDLDEVPLNFDHLQVSVFALTAGGNNPWSAGNPPSFSIEFESAPVLVE